MVGIFEVTNHDINALRDDELRELVGMLCESDYRNGQLRTSGIIWGGSQDSADGGFDVVVHDSISPPTKSNIPRSFTGFQVKKPAMGPAEILKEMKPKGVLRESIRTLIREKGAYIIVCAKTSSPYSAIKIRVEAMRKAVSDNIGHENLHLDFYDCGRLATWVRHHPSIALWIKQKLGRPQKGWQPYGNWSACPEISTDQYLLDEELRFQWGTPGAKTVSEAINFLRNQLSHPKSFVRLVGLSGVGKTRFAQALFDENIGLNCLNSSIAIYTDISNYPQPDPVALVHQLIAEKNNAIIIVDNCPPDLHRKLVHACSTNGSLISILTIEYDVTDDLPEETDVIRLEPASDQLIRKLVERRFPHISQIDAQTIADFSSGNSRVAIALANTIKRGETLGRLQDEELFKRLFDQTNERNDGLLRSAQVLSLTYSFEGTIIESNQSEIEVLANLIELSSTELYRNVSELQRRQLIQSRGPWRAILPHAIANRLAEQALRSIPIARILKALMPEGRERLLRSFSRRLGFLHDNSEAKEIAAKWLATNGWLGGSNGNFSDLGFEIFKNIAPIAPANTLASIEDWVEKSNNTNIIYSRRLGEEYSRILRLIAYDPLLFSRCTKLICQFRFNSTTKDSEDSINKILQSLFSIYLSGTHATASIRAQLINDLWDDGDERKQELAILLLDTAYETWHFTSFYEFKFGARSRDCGWEPKSDDDVNEWYRTFISLGKTFALSNFPKASEVKLLLARHFRGLWTQAKIYNELEELSDELLKIGPWNEGWIATRQVRKFDFAECSLEAMQQLRRLEDKLKPQTLLEMSKTYILSDPNLSWDIFDVEESDIDGTSNYMRKIAESLGQEAAVELDVLTELLPALVITNNDMSRFFSKGLADASTDKLYLWNKIKSAYTSISRENIRVQFLMGFLSAPTMNSFRDAILDEMVEEPILDEIFPQVQMVSTITERELERLQKSLHIGKAPIGMFRYIGWGRAHETISDDLLVPYVGKILKKEGGALVALEIMRTRLTTSGYVPPGSTLQFCREILLSIPYNNQTLDRTFSAYSLVELTDKCMKDNFATEAAKEFCKLLLSAIEGNQINAVDHWRLLAKMAELQPMVFMDVFLTTATTKNYRVNTLFNSIDRSRNPLKGIKDKDILVWCELDPPTRYTLIASAINAIVAIENKLDWNPLVFEIIDRSKTTTEILDILAKEIIPNSWSGSRAAIILARAELLQKLFTHSNAQVASWARTKYESALIKAQQAKEWDEQCNREINETFE